MTKQIIKFYIPDNTTFLKYKFLEWFKSYKPVPDFPEDIQIQTITGCNASCQFCPNGKTKTQIKPTKMDDDLYQKIVNESIQNKVKRISPYLMNEPLLDKNIGWKIRYIADRKPRSLSVKINTNASMLNGNMRDQILNSGLDRLNISFHGISKSVYEESMGGLKFEEVLSNVNNFIMEKKKRKLKEPQVRVVMVKTKLINKEIDKIREYWRERGVGTHIRPMENRTNSLIQRKNLNPDKWHHFRWCKRLFTQAYILATGDVVQCCVDWDRTTILGNVKDKSIKEIWNGDKAVSIRKKFLNDDFRGLLCNKCLKQLSH